MIPKLIIAAMSERKISLPELPRPHHRRFRFEQGGVIIVDNEFLFKVTHIDRRRVHTVIITDLKNEIVMEKNIGKNSKPMTEEGLGSFLVTFTTGPRNSTVFIANKYRVTCTNRSEGKTIFRVDSTNLMDISFQEEIPYVLDLREILLESRRSIVT